MKIKSLHAIASIVFSLFVVVVCLVGCASPGREASETPVNVSQLSEGYALLYDLLSKEKHVNLLLLVKKETPQLKAVIKKIAEGSGEIANELETLSKANPPLNLKVTNLPRVEQDARAIIDSETGKALLKVKGVPFEFKLLHSQVQGMSYGAYLAKALAEVETNATRKAFLQKTEKKLFALHDEVYQMILNRYAR